MKKYRIYSARVFDGEQKFIPAKDLKWEPTEHVYDDYDEAYVHKCDFYPLMRYINTKENKTL